VVFHGCTEIARHPRLIAKGAERVVLDHFLEVLLAKPGALAGSGGLEDRRGREGAVALEARRAAETVGPSGTGRSSPTWSTSSSKQPTTSGPRPSSDTAA
jgi:hypothetical protein